MNAMFLIGQQVLAGCQIPISQGLLYGSVAFFCRSCGETWGHFYINGQKWHQDYAPCTKHGSPGYPGGSFLNGLGAIRLMQFQQHFPHDFWLHELRCLATDDSFWE